MGHSLPLRLKPLWPWLILKSLTHLLKSWLLLLLLLLIKILSHMRLRAMSRGRKPLLRELLTILRMLNLRSMMRWGPILGMLRSRRPHLTMRLMLKLWPHQRGRMLGRMLWTLRKLMPLG